MRREAHCLADVRQRILVAAHRSEHRGPNTIPIGRIGIERHCPIAARQRLEVSADREQSSCKVEKNRRSVRFYLKCPCQQLDALVLATELQERNAEPLHDVRISGISTQQILVNRYGIAEATFAMIADRAFESPAADRVGRAHWTFANWVSLTMSCQRARGYFGRRRMSGLCITGFARVSLAKNDRGNDARRVLANPA